MYYRSKACAPSQLIYSPDILHGTKTIACAVCCIDNNSIYLCCFILCIADICFSDIQIQLVISVIRICTQLCSCFFCFCISGCLAKGEGSVFIYSQNLIACRCFCTDHIIGIIRAFKKNLASCQSCRCFLSSQCYRDIKRRILCDLCIGTQICSCRNLNSVNRTIDGLCTCISMIGTCGKSPASGFRFCCRCISIYRYIVIDLCLIEFIIRNVHIDIGCFCEGCAFFQSFCCFLQCRKSGCHILCCCILVFVNLFCFCQSL